MGSQKAWIEHSRRSDCHQAQRSFVHEDVMEEQPLRGLEAKRYEETMELGPY